MNDRLAYRVPEVCRMLGISRATFYRRVTTGELSVKKLGGVSLVTRESLERLIAAPDATPGLAGDAVRRVATD
jgi:excisionase family DNA binding protein